MKDPNQVLEQKEAELARVRKEVDSLNTVAPLLADDDHTSPDDSNRSRDRLNKKPSSSAGDTVSLQSESEATAADARLPTNESSFLNALKSAM
jgi:hypothetical protein